MERELACENENEGLITQLKERVGTLKRLSKLISGLQNYKEGPRMAGMTSDDCNKLQVIQSSLNRLLTYHILSLVHKVIQSGKPKYITKKLEVEHGTELERRARRGTTIKASDDNFDISRAVFIYCGSNLFNSVTRSIRE